jgi:hypothetical protein
MYNFGPIMRLRNTGVFTVETWKDRWADEIAAVAFDYPVYEVKIIDVKNGVITVGNKDDQVPH